MYLVNKSSKLEPVNRVYKIREKSQSLLDHPRKTGFSRCLWLVLCMFIASCFVEQLFVLI